jgi:UV DNA damage endonuclease
MEEKTSKRGKVTLENAFEEKSLQFGRFKDKRYSKSDILSTWTHNLSKIEEMIPKILSLGIKSIRLSSNIFPLAEEMGDELSNNQPIMDKLQKIGSFVKGSGIRISCHPSQFVVLSSKNPNVILNSIKNLAHHAWVFDSMGLDCSPYYSINIHGGVKGEFNSLIEQTINLPENIKGRLTFENDERAFSVQDLYYVFQKTGVPVVYDWHHHAFNDGNLHANEASSLAISTWSGYKPNMHLSNSEPEFNDAGSFTEKRKHSFYTHHVPEELKSLLNKDEVDCDWEFKGKNLAIFKAVEQFNLKL